MAKLWVQKLPIQPRSRKASDTKVLHLDAVTDNLDLLSIVILSHNRRDSLEANLQYYLNNLEYDFELIVCDNQSSDGSAKLLRDLQEQHTALRVVYNEKNLGVGAGRNSGYAPLGGNIFKVLVSPGDAVEEGDVLIILEAMKMETEVRAPKAGTIGEVFIKVGDAVSPDDEMLTIA